jgi:hypothetical protein
MDQPRDLFVGRARYFTPTGLIVLFDAPRQPAPSQEWSNSPAGVSFPSRPGPSLTDQMVVVCDEQALGIVPPSTLDEVREHLRGLPYVPASVITGRIATLLWPIRDEPEQQLKLATDIFGEDARIIDDFRRFLAEGPGPGRYIFHEQQFFVLLRLILEEGSEPDHSDSWSEDDLLRLYQAMIKVTSVVEAGSSKFRQSDRTPEDWLGFLTQNSVYNAIEEPLLAYQRAWRIFGELAVDAESQAHPEFCDLRAWHRDHLGIDLDELLAVGHSIEGRTQGPDVPADQRAVVPPLQTYLSPTTLAPRHEAVTEVFSAPRSFYVDGFKRSHDNELRLAWETTPFMTKPLLRLPDDSLCLTSPRALQSFLTDGIYYRFLDIAAQEGERDHYTGFVGWLVERYVVEVFADSFGPRDAGNGRVTGDQEYAGKKTSDVAVDYGEDLVLVEVISTRLPLGVRAEADEAELTKYLKRTIDDKLEQVDRVITDLDDKRARIPDVDIGAVQRIWPVLVTQGDLLPAGPLLSYVDQATKGMFEQAGVQPRTMLGLADVEMLMGMIVAGENLIDVLREKATGEYANLPFSRWLTDVREPLPARPPQLEQRWFDSTDALAGLLDLDPPPRPRPRPRPKAE